jgi:hypothetical protein
MQNVMHRFVMLAAVVVLAASSVNCANSPENILAPSTSDGIAMFGANARGGGGKPGPGTGVVGGGSLTYKMVIDNNNDGVPSFRDTVTFIVQTTATAYPYVTLRCYQNGTLVSQDLNAMFAHSLDQNFTLGPTQAWTSGAADCTATLENRDAKNGSITVLASTSFHVN